MFSAVVLYRCQPLQKQRQEGNEVEDDCDKEDASHNVEAARTLMEATSAAERDVSATILDFGVRVQHFSELVRRLHALKVQLADLSYDLDGHEMNDGVSHRVLVREQVNVERLYESRSQRLNAADNVTGLAAALNKQLRIVVRILHKMQTFLDFRVMEKMKCDGAVELDVEELNRF